MANNNNALQSLFYRLRQFPDYLAAASGRPIQGAPFPQPTSKYQAAENARWVASQHDVEIPGGQIHEDGTITDPNADHWYSDPRVLGPAIVGGLTLGAGAFAGGGAGAAGAAGGGGAASGGGAAAAGVGTGASLGSGAPLGALIGKTAISGGLELANSYFTNRANSRSVQAQIDAANHAADLQAQSAADALAFQKEQEATRKAEFDETNQRNYGLEQDRLARNAPFLNTGQNALRQLLQPIRQRQGRA